MDEKVKAFLLVSDDNYMKGLIAQINSIQKNFNKYKIYILHSLSQENLNFIRKEIYKEKKFDDFLFKHINDKKGHITKLNFGKFMPDFIEEDNFFYMDTDVIILKNFEWEFPKTISCASRIIDTKNEEKYGESIKLMQEFVIKNKGIIEKDNNIKIFLDGSFFANKEWFIKELRPQIIEASNKMPQGVKHWYGLGFFNAALDILKRPVEEWKLKQILTTFDKSYNLGNYHLIHFLGKEKPWLTSKTDFSEVWKENYLNGILNGEEYEKV